MSDVRNYPKQFLTEFIELYRSLPSIWKLKSREYADRKKKVEAYRKMAVKLKEVEPNADRYMVIRKINSLRSSYRKEKRKVRESMKAEGKEIHVPKLWYYEMFSFLDGQESSTSLFKAEKVYSQDGDDDIDSDGNSLLERRSPSKSISESESLITTASSTIQNHSKREIENEEMATPTVKRFSDNNIEDEHDIFGRYVAIRLRKLPKTQRLYLEKIINDAIFEAELGNLSRGYFHTSEEYNNK